MRIDGVSTVIRRLHAASLRCPSASRAKATIDGESCLDLRRASAARICQRPPTKQGWLGAKSRERSCPKCSVCIRWRSTSNSGHPTSRSAGVRCFSRRSCSHCKGTPTTCREPHVAAMLELSWQQPSYQTDQTPPTGALIFELYGGVGLRNVSVSYVAQSLDDMRSAAGRSPRRTPVPIPGCSSGSLCTLDDFAKLVEQSLDPECSE
jgi:hypothetical protein